MQVQDIVKTAVFDAPIGKVWEAVSTADGIAAWFMPNDFKAEAGSSFTIQSPFGPSPCLVLEISPPERLVFTWGENWQIRFELKDMGGKTEFTLTHAGWGESDQVIEQSGMTQAAARDRMNGGWEAIVQEKLRSVVEA